MAPREIQAVAGQPVEWHYLSGQKYGDPYNDIDLDVVVSDEDGESWRVPAYWAGGQEWRVRFAAPKPRRYTATTECSNAADASLHGIGCAIEAVPRESDNPLYAHGPLRVASSRRTFEHADGTPFFWLGDTWWMGLCGRMTWPDEFQRLIADRVAKGFTVIQIVAGLYPDLLGPDPRAANEAGFPFEPDYASIRPAYFDMADLRIQWLVRSGLLPCIFSCWGYYLPVLGADKMKKFWRYLIARWGAYPVVWCLAGEAAMPYYLSTTKHEDSEKQIAGWAEIARYVRETDPYGRLITIHPKRIGRDDVADDSVLDFDMLQTGHGGHESLPNTINTVRAEVGREPTMPVLIGEVNYEGIMHGTAAETQRQCFWIAMLSGAAGHTYGANGIWQVNTKEKPFGPSPRGGTWGNTPWDEAARLPGAAQLGVARRILERYRWWEFEPHPEWVEPCGGPEKPDAPFAAGIPGEVRVIYLYSATMPWHPPEERSAVVAFEEGVRYRASYHDPRNGDIHDIGIAEPDADGRWEMPMQPTYDDWVLVLDATEWGAPRSL